MLHEPQLIILDEPFSGLDPVNSNLIKDEIYNLAKNGSTIIFSTHRMEQVEEICNQIVLINKGKKILDGSVKTIKQNYKQNLFKVSFYSTPGNINNPSFDVVKKNEDESLIIKINNGYQPNDVLSSLVNNHAQIQSFNELLPSLNDIFIQLVEGTPAARQFQNVPA